MIDPNDSYNVSSKQRVLLSMMIDFHKFCMDHDVSYSIIGGTLLGAIREKGFIPWDDDIDVLVDRANFEKLRELSPDLGKYCICELLWVYKIVDKATYYQQGITEDTPVIDVFIVDRVPSGRVKKVIKTLGLKTLQGMMKTKINDKKNYSFGYRVALNITAVFGKVFSKETKQKMYTLLSMWGNEETTQPFMICNDVFQSLGCEYDRKLMDKYVLVTFENTELLAIANWENYLTEQYGDYMKPVRMEH